MDDKGNAPLLETIDLKKYFKVGGGTLHAVDSINIKLYQGETLGVVGESGCGKSVTSLSLMQLVQGPILSRPPVILSTTEKTLPASISVRCGRCAAKCRSSFKILTQALIHENP